MNDEQPPQINRLQIGLGVLLQVFLLLVILVMVNYLGFNHYRRWDYSRNEKYTLSDQTKLVFKSLKKPLKIVVFFADSPLLPDVDALIKECQYLGRKNVEFETVDPYRNITRGRELQAKYKFGDKENIVVLDYNGRTKFVTAEEMAEWDRSGEMLGQPPRMVSFKGEQALVSALISLSEQAPEKIFFLTGHGEPEPKSLNLFKTYLERQNLQIDSLNLAGLEQPPAEAAALVLIGPKYDFSERDIQLLKAYWEKRGRLFVALDPSAQTPNLHAFLDELGVKPNEDRILRTVKLPAGFTGVLKDVEGEFIPESGPVTRRLKNVNVAFLGGTQSLQLDAERVRPARIKLQGLIKAVQGFWGETEFNIVEGSPIYFSPTTDHAPPLVMAASVEQRGVEDARVKVDSSRMLVVGNSTFLNTDGLTQANLDFALSSLNWLLDREELIGIAPKVPKTFSLNLTEAQLGNLALLTMIAMPAAALSAGVLAWFKRRR